jgi:hypothetical protein
MKGTIPSAFSAYYPSLARQLTSEIFVANSMLLDKSKLDPETAGAIKYNAIWDTGATTTAISQRIVDELKLPVVSRGSTNTAGGAIPTTGHLIDIWLPNRFVVSNCVASCVNLKILGVDALIGMDVISQGDFSVSNFNGKTIMSFRMPSLEDVDYVKQGEPGRNALCPCGSGKKYKHCHGK